MEEDTLYKAALPLGYLFLFPKLKIHFKAEDLRTHHIKSESSEEVLRPKENSL